MTFWQRMGGRKNAALYSGLIIPNWLVIILSFIRDSAIGYDFAIKFTGITLLGIIAFISGNVIQHIKLKG